MSLKETIQNSVNKILDDFSQRIGLFSLIQKTMVNSKFDQGC